MLINSDVIKDSSTIKQLDQILIKALQQQASDIHIEPYHGYYRIRFRIDGILTEHLKIEPALGQRLNSRLKIMANLDIAEKRIPQDGRFAFKLSENQKTDCRLSTCPMVFGEKLVVRILNPIIVNSDLQSLELDQKENQIFFSNINLSQGMILVTGPTGSGKTTTLYTAINLLNQTNKNISTAEDPVEIFLDGVNQVEVNHKIGLDFALVLRAFLRQDPDIIMIGEIRDLETAEIAINAAHTGHLVLATLHTNSAIASLTRLLNIGVPGFNLASALKLIISQRLVRRSCPYCKTQGCEQCRLGYRGRTAVFEMLEITSTLSNLILEPNNISKIEKYLQQINHQTIQKAALNKINLGITTLSEVNRVMNLC